MFKIIVFALWSILVWGFSLPFIASVKSNLAIPGVISLMLVYLLSIGIFWQKSKTEITAWLRRLGIVAIIPLLLSACSTVPSGHVGIKVYLLGGDKGVDMEELGVGRYWIGWNEELYLFPTFQQNYVWTKSGDKGSPNDESITFQTVEGMSVNADFGISYNVDPNKVPMLFQKYRRGLDEITDTFLRNMVRDALNKRASRLPVESVYGAGKQSLIDSSQQDVARQVIAQGLIVDRLYLINDFRLPPKVVDALNAKIEATQKAQQRENEVAEAFAQARIDSARAMGTKMKQQLESQTLTPTLLQKMWLDKWDGHLPSVLAGGNSEKLMLMLPNK